MNILSMIESNLLKKIEFNRTRIPTYNPSSAMCNSRLDGSPIGTCIRANYYKSTEAPTSNPTTMYVAMTAEAGNIWEDWVVNQYKELGIFIDSSIKFYDVELNSSGEIDILHYNPLTGDTEITEVKQYNGGNYTAVKEITGSKDTTPRPKDAHLLQVFTYLLMCKNTGNTSIKTINILYIDRSCSSVSNNIQFRVSLIKQNEDIYPEISFFKEDKESSDSYIDYRITEKGVVSKIGLLDSYLERQELPPRDYQLIYPDDKVEYLFLNKQISKTKYQKWSENKLANPIGDWNCTYCPYGYGYYNDYSTCYGGK